MAVSSAGWVSVLSLLQLVPCCVTLRLAAGDSLLVDEEQASSFLSRSLLYNSWDFELVVPDDLQRECLEETCSYEEAREVFEDDAQTQAFWAEYINNQVNSPGVDVSGLVAGILALLGCALIATVVGVYCYKARQKSNRRPAQVPVRLVQDGQPPPEMVPLAGIMAPALPSYHEALTRSGQHDAPPPPYSGGAPSEPADPGERD
ncbi:transmembrane gamma-carboxyglutamic acid protein 2 [Neosynchiropus ocellatus]